MTMSTPPLPPTNKISLFVLTDLRRYAIRQREHIHVHRRLSLIIVTVKYVKRKLNNSNTSSAALVHKRENSDKVLNPEYINL